MTALKELLADIDDVEDGKLPQISAATLTRARSSSETFRGLVSVVQYRRKRGADDWHNMAAFDNRVVADRYAADCSKGDLPWDYQVIDIPSNH